MERTGIKSMKKKKIAFITGIVVAVVINLIKSVIDGVVTFVLYKYLSRHLKETV